MAWGPAGAAALRAALGPLRILPRRPLSAQGSLQARPTAAAGAGAACWQRGAGSDLSQNPQRASLPHPRRRPAVVETPRTRPPSSESEGSAPGREWGRLRSPSVLQLLPCLRLPPRTTPVPSALPLRGHGLAAPWAPAPWYKVSGPGIPLRPEWPGEGARGRRLGAWTTEPGRRSGGALLGPRKATRVPAPPVRAAETASPARIQGLPPSPTPGERR